MQSTSNVSSTRLLNSTFYTSIMLVISILLIAANLRAPITGIAPVLDLIITSVNLSSAQAGMLTALPLIAFAIASPLAAMLAKKLGLELSLFVALIFIMLGCASRLLNSSAALFIGTAVIGIGIAIGNVLLPSLIKRDFPHKVAMMTSAYVLVMGMIGGAFSALVIPFSELMGTNWQVSLAAFSLVTMVTIFIWIPRLSRPANVGISNNLNRKTSSVWRFSLSWQVTFFLGGNSLFTYIIVGWLPSILIENQHSAEQAGIIHGVFLIATAVPGLVLVPVLAKLTDQRIPAVSIALLAAMSSLSLYYYPQWAFQLTMVLGFCSGACFILGLSFISLRTQNSLQAAALSGMAQCIGYSLAAIGPMLTGYLHSITNDWSGALWLCALANLICAFMGLGCGRNLKLPLQSTAK